MEPSGIFKGYLIIGKLIILVTLLILSFINGHKEYVEKNPRKFMWDSFAAGGFGALGLVVIGMLRGVTDGAHLAEIGFTTFLLLFTFNVFCEFSGFNTGGEEHKLTQGEHKIMKAKIPIAVMFLVGLAILFALAWNVQAKAKVSGNPIDNSKLFVEALIFGIASGAAQAVNSKNHGESAVKTTGMTIGATIFFAILYIALQNGGLMDAIYSQKPPCVNF